MIAPTKRKELLREAEKLAGQLTSYRTPNTAEPVDPSRLVEVERYLRTRSSVTELGPFLKRLPGSYLGKITRSAEPQLRVVAEKVELVARTVTEVEELLYVLAWARRYMAIHEGRGHSGPPASRPGRPGAGPRR